MNRLKIKRDIKKNDEKYIILLIFNLLSIISILFFTLKYFFEKNYLSFFILLFFFVVNALNLTILLIKRKTDLTAKILVYFFYLLIILLFIFAPSKELSLLWFFLFPSVSIFLTGRKNTISLFLSLVAILTIIYLFFPSILVIHYDAKLLIRILFISVIITIIIYVYELNKEKNNSELRKYIEEIEKQREELLNAKKLLEKYNKNLETKNQEQILQKKKYETLIENLGNGFAILNYKGEFLYVNKTLADILEKYKAQILQLNIKDLFTYSETLKILNSFEKIKNGGKVEIQVSYKVNNEKKILNLIIYETYNEEQKGKEIALVVKDNTELWEREQMILEQTKELKTSQKRLTEQNDELYALKEVIEQKEKRLRNILDNLGEGVLIVSNEKFITYANYAANIIFETYDLRGKYLNEIMSESVYEMITKQAIIGSKEKFTSFDIEIPTESGGKKYLSITAAPDFNEKGQIIGTVAVLNDITDLIKNQEIIKERMNQLSILINHLPAYVYFKDKELKYILINDTYSKLIGKNKNEIIGKTYSDLFPEDKEVEQTDIKIINTQKPQLGVEIFKFGRWLNLSKVPYFDHKGEIKGIIGIMVDITRQKLQADDLKNFQIAVQNIPVGIVISNLKGKVIFTNNAFINIFGYTFEQINTLTEKFNEPDKIPAGHLRELYTSIINGKKFDSKFDYFNRKKNVIYKLECHYIPVYNENNEIYLYVGSYTILDSKQV